MIYFLLLIFYHIIFVINSTSTSKGYW